MTRQTLEMDADSSGATVSFQNILQQVTHGINSNESRMPVYYKSPQDAVFVWSFSLAAVFHLWGLKLDANNLLTSFHPPTGLRHYIVYSTVERMLQLLNPELTGVFNKTFNNAVDEMHNAASAIGDINPSRRALECAIAMSNPRTAEHMLALLRRWKVLRPQLLRYAAVDDLAPIQDV